MSRIADDWIGQLRGGRAVHHTHLRHELAHVLGARAGCRLVCHRADPFDEPRAEQAGHRHQHQADGAVAADEIGDARVERLVDDARG